MPLQPRVLHIAAGVGIQEGTRPEHIEPGASNLVNENVRATERLGLDKRWGFSAQTLSRLSGSRSAGYKLFTLGQQTCVVDGHTIDVYSPATTANVNKDRVPECLPTRIPLPWPGFNPFSTDIVACNGYVVVSTYDGTSKIALFVLDATSYSLVSGPFNITSVTHAVNAPHVVAVGTTAIVVYRSGTNALSARTISLSSAANINTGWSGATSLCTDYNGVGIDAHGYEDRFAIAYGNTSGGASRVSVKTFNTSLSNLQTQTIASNSIDPTRTALAGSNADTLWVAWTEAELCRVRGITGNSLSTTLATTTSVIALPTNPAVTMGMVVTGTGTGRLVVTEGETGVAAARDFITSGGAVATSGSTQTWYNCLFLSRPFRIDGRNYAGAFYWADSAATNLPVNEQSIHCIVDVEGTASLRPICNIAPRLSVVGTNGATQHYASISSTKVAVANVVSRTGGLGFGQGRAVEVTFLDFAATNRWQTTQFANYAFSTGGFYFDGHRFREVNFINRPNLPTVAGGSAGGPTQTAALYVVVAEKFDAAGNCEMSAPSDPSLPITTANIKAVVTISTLPFSAQTDGSTSDTDNPIRFAVYRSGDNGALPYRRLGTVDNVTTAATVTYTDASTDASANAKLYSQPGLVGTDQPRACPPALHHVVAYGDMLVGVGDDLVTLWWTGQYIIGEGVWFADVFQAPVTEGGPTTGIAVMDGTLFVFKRRAIFAVAGEAPSNNGSTGGLGAPRRLGVDVGCIDSRSIVVTSGGIFFQSERGLELLTRAQSVQPVGEAVQDTLAANPNVTAATLDASESAVYFELASTETANQVSSTGCAVVFDLTQGFWVSKDRRKNNAGTADTPAQSAGMIYTGSAWRYAWLGTDGRVYYEDRSTYLDVARWVTKRWEPSEIKQGLQQEQKLWQGLLLVEPTSAAGVVVECSYDRATYSGANDKTWLEAAALSQRHLPFTPNENAHTAKFRVSDTAPAVLGTGQGPIFVGMSFDLAPKQGATHGTPQGDESLRR